MMILSVLSVIALGAAGAAWLLVAIVWAIERLLGLPREVGGWMEVGTALLTAVAFFAAFFRAVL